MISDLTAWLHGFCYIVITRSMWILVAAHYNDIPPVYTVISRDQLVTTCTPASSFRANMRLDPTLVGLVVSCDLSLFPIYYKLRKLCTMIIYNEKKRTPMVTNCTVSD